jgi:hypothetical protein
MKIIHVFPAERKPGGIVGRYAPYDGVVPDGALSHDPSRIYSRWVATPESTHDGVSDGLRDGFTLHLIELEAAEIAAMNAAGKSVLMAAIIRALALKSEGYSMGQQYWHNEPPEKGEFYVAGVRIDLNEAEFFVVKALVDAIEGGRACG